MGGGGSKDHQSFTVAPSPPGSAGPAPAGPIESVPDSAAYNQLGAAVAEIDSAGSYDELVAATGHAQDLVEAATGDGIPPQLLADAKAGVHGAAKAWLAGQSNPELAGLAAQAGFAHPTLVGLSGAGPTHPLEHWLDPSYPPDIASKAKIAAKADERYDALKAGHTINGLALADVDAAEADLAHPPPPGSWAATPEHVVAAQAALSDSLTALKAATTTAERSKALGEVVAAENTLAGAQCPQMAAVLAGAQGSAKAAVDQAFGLSPQSGYKAQLVKPLVEAAVDAGAVPEATASVASPAEAFALLRASTSPAERAGITDALPERTGQLVGLTGLTAKLTAAGVGPNGPPSLALGPVGTDEGKAALASFAATAGEFYTAKAEVAVWAPSCLAGPYALEGYKPHGIVGRPELTTAFRAWAKAQPVGDLRAVAAKTGLDHVDHATRAEAQNWVAASWDHSIDKSQIAASTKAKAQAKASPAKAPSPAPAPSGQPAPASSPAPPVAGAGVGDTKAGVSTGRTFASRHLALVEALKHHNATVAALPARPPVGEVAVWAFSPGPAKVALGGMHTKSLHTAPDGSVWMFKADSTNGGRAAAEAAASEVFTRVGVPSVPVYARRVGGKAGTVQPLLSGTSNLSPSPSSWSQADVDALVRVHVAAWAVGDHDGKADNLLRTGAGGIIPVDQGQAFKFFGKDKLSSSYHPNSGYGSPKGVYHQAYEAAKAGGLAKGVAIRPEAALPTIKAFEAMPDGQYRAILAATATDGVAHKVHWYPEMRARAAKRHGKTNPSDKEVATEFLDYAVARKAGLRAAFAGFFAGEGFAGATKLTKVA